MNKAVFAGTELRVMLHERGAWADEAAKKILEGLPTSSLPAIRAVLEPSMFAMRLSGYIPAMFDFPEAGHEGTATLVPARTEFFDRVLAQDWKQVVILGAGYDTRAYGRLEKDRTRVFEVDRAPIQAQKIVVLDRVGIVRDGVTYVAADFAAQSWLADLIAAGFDPQNPGLLSVGRGHHVSGARQRRGNPAADRRAGRHRQRCHLRFSHRPLHPFRAGDGVVWGGDETADEVRR
jgi:hypothetical protein